MTIPQTYKRAVFKSAGTPLVIEQVPLTLPGPNEILVKVEACGVCFSDVFAQNNVMGGGLYVSTSFHVQISIQLTMDLFSPIVPGHEIVGHVAALGDNVSGWTVGDRIGGAWHGGHDGTTTSIPRGGPITKHD